MVEEVEFEVEFKNLEELWGRIAEYERRLKAKFIGADVESDAEGGRAVARFIYPVGRIDDEEVAVSVWNCRAALFIGGKSEDGFKLSEEQREAIERWKEYVIYEENGGAINWSGIYYPSPYAVEILKEILAGNPEAVNKLEACDADEE